MSNICFLWDVLVSASHQQSSVLQLTTLNMEDEGLKFEYGVASGSSQRRHLRGKRTFGLSSS